MMEGVKRRELKVLCCWKMAEEAMSPQIGCLKAGKAKQANLTTSFWMWKIGSSFIMNSFQHSCL